MSPSRPRRSRVRLPALALLVAAALATPAAAQTDFITFESGQVRPLLLTPDGATLLALNTPDNSLEIFSVSTGGLSFTGSVPVGMEPVALAIPGNAANDHEVWVVNHLSDSVSIVDLSATPPRVTRTLLVGDEPRDIVFAGTNGNRAFVTTAHRGQHRTDPRSARSRARATRSSPPRGSAGPTSGSSTRRTSAGRSAAPRSRS